MDVVFTCLLFIPFSTSLSRHGQEGVETEVFEVWQYITGYLYSINVYHIQCLKSLRLWQHTTGYLHGVPCSIYEVFEMWKYTASYLHGVPNEVWKYIIGYLHSLFIIFNIWSLRCGNIQQGTFFVYHIQCLKYLRWGNLHHNNGLW